MGMHAAKGAAQSTPPTFGTCLSTDLDQGSNQPPQATRHKAHPLYHKPNASSSYTTTTLEIQCQASTCNWCTLIVGHLVCWLLRYGLVECHYFNNPSSPFLSQGARACQPLML